VKLIIPFTIFLFCIKNTFLSAQNLPMSAPAWLSYSLQNASNPSGKTLWRQINTSKIANEFQKTGHNYQGSGRVEAIYVSPKDNNYILAGSNSSGLFKTINGGKTWENITNNPKNKGFAGMGINAIAVNPSNENQIVLATSARSFLDKDYGCGIVESLDGGSTWNINIAFLNTVYNYNSNYVKKPPIVGCVKFSPYVKGMLIATCYNLILKSTDFGKTWQIACIVDLRLTEEDNFRFFKLTDIEFSPDKKTIFVTGEDAQFAVNGGTVVLQSNNNGKKWKKVNLPKNWQMLLDSEFNGEKSAWKTFPEDESLRMENGKAFLSLKKGEKKILYNLSKSGGFAANNSMELSSKIHVPNGVVAKYIFKNSFDKISLEKDWNEAEISFSENKTYTAKHALSCYGLLFDATNSASDVTIELDYFRAYPTSIELANVEVLDENIIKILYLERPWRNHLVTYNYKKNKVLEDIFNPNDVRIKGLDYVSIDWNYDFAVSKSNPNVIYVGNTLIRKSIDGGKSFKQISTYNAKYKNGDFTHCDVRTFQILKETSGETEECIKKGCKDVLIMGNDGGISITNNGGDENWTNLNGEGFIATQIEGLGVSNTDTSVMSYGAWDNGLNVKHTDYWKYILQSDAFDQEINYDNETLGLFSGGNVSDKIQHYNIESNKLSKSINKPFEKKHEWKSNSAYNAPIRILPNGEMFIATQELYKYKNGVWNKLSNIFNSDISNKKFNNYLSAFDFSFQQDSVFWLCSEKDNDLPSQVWVRRNMKWENVSGNLPIDKGISAIACHPKNASNAYVAYMGIKNELNKNAIFFTRDFGKSWQDVSEGITPYSINKLMFVELDKERLIAAADDGVYYFNEKNKQWKKMSEGLPNVVATDVEFQPELKRLYISTWGQGLWCIDLEKYHFD